VIGPAVAIPTLTRRAIEGGRPWTIVGATGSWGDAAADLRATPSFGAPGGAILGLRAVLGPFVEDDESLTCGHTRPASGIIACARRSDDTEADWERQPFIIRW
jgi:hypothetical protein